MNSVNSKTFSPALFALALALVAGGFTGLANAALTINYPQTGIYSNPPGYVEFDVVRDRNFFKWCDWYLSGIDTCVLNERGNTFEWQYWVEGGQRTSFATQFDSDCYRVGSRNICDRVHIRQNVNPAIFPVGTTKILHVKTWRDGTLQYFDERSTVTVPATITLAGVYPEAGSTKTLPTDVRVTCRDNNAPSGDCYCSFWVNRGRTEYRLGYTERDGVYAAQGLGNNVFRYGSNHLKAVCYKNGQPDNKATAEWDFTASEGEVVTRVSMNGWTPGNGQSYNPDLEFALFCKIEGRNLNPNAVCQCRAYYSYHGGANTDVVLDQIQPGNGQFEKRYSKAAHVERADDAYDLRYACSYAGVNAPEHVTTFRVPQLPPALALSANPNSGTGEFTSVLTATNLPFATNIPKIASFDCLGNGQATRIPYIGTTAAFPCRYPVVQQQTVFTAKVTDEQSRQATTQVTDNPGAPAPSASLTANPDNGVGPFSSTLTASFANMPNGVTRAKFWCRPGDGPYVELISGGVATHVCNYPQVRAQEVYDASVGAGGTNQPGGFLVEAHARVTNNPQSTPSVTLDGWDPGNTVHSETSPVTFRTFCLVNGVRSPDCSCTAVYSFNNGSNHDVPLAVNRQNNGYYSQPVPLASGAYNDFIVCSHQGVQGVTPQGWFTVRGGGQNFAFCKIDPSVASITKGDSFDFAVKCFDDARPRNEIDCPTDYYYDWNLRVPVGRVSPNGQATTTLYSNAVGSGALAVTAKKNREWVVCTSASVNVHERGGQSQLTSCTVNPNSRTVDVGFDTRFLLKCFDQNNAQMNCPNAVEWGVVGDNGVWIGRVQHDAGRAWLATFSAYRVGSGTVTAIAAENGRYAQCTARVRVNQPSGGPYPDDAVVFPPFPTASITPTPTATPSPSPRPSPTPTPTPTPSPRPGEFAYCRIMPAVVSFSPSGSVVVNAKCFDSTHTREVSCPTGATFTWWSMPTVGVAPVSAATPDQARITWRGGPAPNSGAAYLKITFVPIDAVSYTPKTVYCTACSVNVR